MKKTYVTLNAEKYVNGWSDIPLAGFTEIQAAEELIGILDCIKVNDGIAVLDSEKKEELLNTPEALTEIEQLRQENDILKLDNVVLKERCDATDNAVLELTDLILSGGE